MEEVHFGPYNLDPKAYNLIKKNSLVKGELCWALNGPFSRKTTRVSFSFLLYLQKISKLSNAKDAQRYFKSVFEQSPKHLKISVSNYE